MDFRLSAKSDKLPTQKDGFLSSFPLVRIHSSPPACVGYPKHFLGRPAIDARCHVLHTGVGLQIPEADQSVLVARDDFPLVTGQSSLKNLGGGGCNSRPRVNSPKSAKKNNPKNINWDKIPKSHQMRSYSDSHNDTEGFHQKKPWTVRGP